MTHIICDKFCWNVFEVINAFQNTKKQVFKNLTIDQSISTLPAQNILNCYRLPGIFTIMKYASNHKPVRLVHETRDQFF